MESSPRQELTQHRDLNNLQPLSTFAVQAAVQAADNLPSPTSNPGTNRRNRTIFGLLGPSSNSHQEQEYVVPNYDFHFTADNVDGLLVELQDRSHKLAVHADRHAKIIKGFLVASQVILIVMGIAITVLSFNQCTFGSTDTKYIVGVLGALVTGIEGVRSTFELNKRGNLYRLVYNKALEIARKARLLKLSRMPVEQLERKVNLYYDRLCELDISLYSLRVVKISQEDRQSHSPPISADWPRNRASGEAAADVVPPSMLHTSHYNHNDDNVQSRV